MIDLGDALYSSSAMSEVWSGRARLQRMLDFEAALARAEARAGVIPPDAAEAIVAACHAERFDPGQLFRDTGLSATLAVPLVRALTRLVPEDARGYVHWGATSQDAVDTGFVLQAREALDLLERDLLGLGASCARLAERHRATPMAGRTLLQQALPITFGLKAARWLAMVTRQVERLRQVRERVSVAQLGGAAGTLASLGDAGPRVVAELARELGLSEPDLPWHAERDRVAELAAQLGVVAGVAAKIAQDLVLLAQNEVGEASEGATPGKGGSSTLPQKRNPVDATLALAAARLAIGLVPILLGGMTHEHERAVGAWQAEWSAIPDLFCRTACAVERVRAALDGLEVDAAAMARNLGGSDGLVMAESLAMALAAKVGRHEAQRIVARLASAGASLERGALADAEVRAQLSPEAIRAALDPANYLGSTDLFVDRALAAYARLRT